MIAAVPLGDGSERMYTHTPTHTPTHTRQCTPLWSCSKRASVLEANRRTVSVHTQGHMESRLGRSSGLSYQVSARSVQAPGLHTYRKTTTTGVKGKRDCKPTATFSLSCGYDRWRVHLWSMKDWLGVFLESVVVDLVTAARPCPPCSG